MSGQRKNRHPSPAGKRLLDAIYRKYGESNDSVAEFARELIKTLDCTGLDTVESTLSNMINCDDLKKWNRKYYIGIERILSVRIADIVDGSNGFISAPRGLYEIGTQGKYEDFQWLAEQKDGSVEVIKLTDEWSKGIFDYVYEVENVEGLRYLVDNGFYNIFGPGQFTACCYHPNSDEEHALTILRILVKDKDRAAEIFIKLFDSREHTDLADLSGGVLRNENVMRMILGNEKLFNVVCRKPDIIPESAINGTKRLLTGQEYQAICASNWLTPLLCYTLQHEDEYHDQAIKLLDVSLEVASATLASIGSNKGLLGDKEQSITTKDGHVILGHRYVIGVIGEPQTEAAIKDPVLRQKAMMVASKIGSFRAMAKYQTPVLLNGKIHLPPADQNPLYRKFVEAAKGHPFLLQKAATNDGDACNIVFEAPRGNEAHELSLDQWFQIGQALKSIHQIDTGVKDRVFCHGRFYYADFYVLPDEDIELISGYRDVHLGDFEEDLLAAGFLAFNNNYYRPDTEQEAIEALLEGYGYSSNGFLEKLWDYLIALAKAEQNSNETRYLMNAAAAVLDAIKAAK